MTLSDGQPLAAHHKIDGGPSVLFDAVAIAASDDGGAMLAADATAQDFLTDAFAHCKFICLGPGSGPLLEATGLVSRVDDGCIALTKAGDCKVFVEALAPLRFWAREERVDLDAFAALSP